MIFILIGAIIGIYHEVSRRYCVNCTTLEQCFFWKQKGGGTSAAGAEGGGQGVYNSGKHGKHGNLREFVNSGKLREFKISYCIECRQPVLYRCSMRCRLPVLELIAVYSAGVHERVYFSVTS